MPREPRRQRPMTWNQVVDTVERIDQDILTILNRNRLSKVTRGDLERIRAQETLPVLVRAGRR